MRPLKDPGLMSLEEVRRELDHLSGLRVLGRLQPDESARWEALGAREKELLAQGR
ncbi:MAG TPA: hypothetical protein VE990_07100 [Acidimicrobiales bacterium]|nr:hypothetical protein [Acidimicrobiales bacterium]